MKPDRRTLVASLTSNFAAWLFLAQLVALAMHRIDYPINDDWRYYATGGARGPRFGLPEGLSLDWLLRPARDTLHVTGKLTDWLFFQFVSHDYHLLALVSFVVCMGGWLLCTGRSCFILGRERPAVMLACRCASSKYFGLEVASAKRRFLASA